MILALGVGAAGMTAACDEPPPAPASDKDAVEAAIERIDREFGADAFVHYRPDTAESPIPPPYVVFVESKPAVDPEIVAAEVGDALRALQARFEQDYGLVRNGPKRPRTDAPVPVLVSDFAHGSAEPADARDLEDFEGAYRAEPARIEIRRSERDDSAFASLFYFGTLHLLDEAARAHGWTAFDVAPWLAEGLAEQFDVHRVHRGWSEAEQTHVRTISFYEYDRRRYSRIAAAVVAGDYVPLRELCSLTAREKLAREHRDARGLAHQSAAEHDATRLFRAESWAFVKFLLVHEDGRYRNALLACLRAEVERSGVTGSAAIARELLTESDADWGDLDEQFRTWIFTELRDQVARR